MPEIDTRSTKERNFRIEKTSHDTYVVRSDSERFGKNEITYESWNREDCLNYIAQRRPERKIQFYIIPDLMSWSMPDYFDQRTPIERFDSLQEAVARFQELFAQDYNAEMTDRNSFGLTYTRLALGMEWSEQGQHPGAIDLIHVRKGQKDNASHDDVMKDLCGDFTGIDAFNTDRRLLSMLRQLEHEIGFDRVVFYNDRKATTLPYVLWENEYFEEIGQTEAILESQNAYVIVTLQKDYSVLYETYDKVTVELMDSGKLPRTDYLSFEEAARTALGEPGASLKRHDLGVRDSLLEAVEEFPRNRAVPVYLYSLEQAAERGEKDVCIQSRILNAKLMQQLEPLFSTYYDGRSVHQNIVRALFAEFGPERTSAVLANIIQNRPWEGRFSAENRKWAQTIPLPEGENWNRLTACNVHPGLLDVLTTEVRREIRAQEREHNPDQASSLADRLEAARDSVLRQNPVQEQNTHRTSHVMEL